MDCNECDGLDGLDGNHMETTWQPCGGHVQTMCNPCANHVYMKIIWGQCPGGPKSEIPTSNQGFQMNTKTWSSKNASCREDIICYKNVFYTYIIYMFSIPSIQSIHPIHPIWKPHKNQWGPCGNHMQTMWGKNQVGTCANHVQTMWKPHETHVGAMWKPHEKHCGGHGQA